MNAHEALKTRDCRFPSCTNDASDAPTRGSYANLCAEHRAAEGRRRSAARAGGGDGSSGSPAVGARNAAGQEKPAAASPSAEAKARFPSVSLSKRIQESLVPAAEALEGAIGKRRDATQEIRESLEVFKRELEGVRDCAQAVLAG